MESVYKKILFSLIMQLAQNYIENNIKTICCHLNAFASFHLINFLTKKIILGPLRFELTTSRSNRPETEYSLVHCTFPQEIGILLRSTTQPGDFETSCLSNSFILQSQ